MIQSGEKWAHQMPCLETHGHVVKIFCGCCAGIRWTFSVPGACLWWQCRRRGRQQCPPCLHLTSNRRCDPAAVSQTQRALVTRYHREFNEPSATCGLFIDGHRWRGASPREVKNALDYLGHLNDTVYPAGPNRLILAFSGRKALRNQEAEWKPILY